jgi:hypothetical protein
MEVRVLLWQPAAAMCQSYFEFSKQMHGPEALMVERPVETRQEEIRALLGPHTLHEQDHEGDRGRRNATWPF